MRPMQSRVQGSDQFHPFPGRQFHTAWSMLRLSDVAKSLGLRSSVSVQPCLEELELREGTPMPLWVPILELYHAINLCIFLSPSLFL